ncbi:MAG: PAS domain-containing protein [Phenylobacterium sp.]|uniref:sensor histidine kinase n=1 Tax=Phenylobacterium sp. TaxID=1871053 RepID=UPI001A51385B|nr:PAS domain-containing sensor histidine kinase [Phenylobacterium sp.]MBL8769831.1 PAS domain-containing protein [Phenylobacterium sp.]
MLEATILENLGDAVVALGPDWRIVYLNGKAERRFAVRAQDVLGASVWDRIPALSGTDFEAAARTVMRERSPLRTTLGSADGGRCEVRLFTIEAGAIAAVWSDIFDSQKEALMLRGELERQGLMLVELAHRVANNFQDIAARLRLQARSLTDPEAREVCLQLADSVHCMALVQRRFYLDPAQSGERDLGQYIEALCADLRKGVLPQEVALEIRSCPDIRVSSDAATLLGMMIAELVTNSAKHAWGPHAEGRISVTLRRDRALIDVEIADDGRGFDCRPRGGRAAPGVGLGLLERQIARLGGKMTASRARNGATVHLRFPETSAARGPDTSAHH